MALNEEEWPLQDCPPSSCTRAQQPCPNTLQNEFFSTPVLFFFSSTEAEIKAIYSLTYPGWNGKKERNPAFNFIKNSQAQPVRCWDIRHQKVQIGCIAFAAFKPDPDPIAKKVDTRPKPASCLSDVDVSTLLQLSIKFQVCCHSRSHICLSCPPYPLFLANTEKSCLELWLGSSAVHEKCIHSALFRSLRLWYACHIISMSCQCVY